MLPRNRRRCRWIIGTAAFLIFVSWSAVIARRWYFESTLNEADRLLLLEIKADVVERKLTRLLKWEPDNQRALLMLGVALNRQQSFSKAINVLERANPQVVPESQVALANALVAEGMWRQSEQVLIAYLKVYPDDDEMRKMLLIVLVQTFRKPEAIQLLEDRLGPDVGPDVEFTHLKSLLNLITAPVSAQAVRDELLKHGNRYQKEPEALVALGRCSELTGQSQDAVEYFRQSLALDSTSPHILVRCAGFFLGQGDLALAEQLLLQCHLDQCGSGVCNNWIEAEYWHLKSEIYSARGESIEALYSINKSLVIRERPESLTLKAGLLRKAGRVEEAQELSSRLAEFGRQDFELLKLSGPVKSGRITPQLCLQLEEALSKTGYHRQAVAWRRLAATLPPG